MANKVLPYRGEEFGFPKTLPDSMPSTGFVSWIIQEGYPVELITRIPGFPEDSHWFCHIYDDTNVFSYFHPDNPNYIDPYDPSANLPASVDPETPPEPEVATTFTTATSG